MTGHHHHSGLEFAKFPSILLAACTIFLVNAELVSGASGDSNETENLQICRPGIIFPVWVPQLDIGLGDRVTRGVAYFLVMIYMFLGVSIVSDRFMASIEVITSREKEVKVKRPNGETQLVVIRIWNETVANLTLMALGSSAPEILLSIIEIFGSHFDAGELGPGTIVGSAAFNLLIIIGLCVVVIPNGEIRRIKHLRVFFVTATWSVLAYLWLLVILKFISPGEVEFWEAILTFAFFPLTVGSAYIADRRLLVYNLLSKTYRTNKRGLLVEGEHRKASHDDGFPPEEDDEKDNDPEQSRRDYIQLLSDLRKKNPGITSEKLEELARDEIVSKGPKSRAYYRMQATRKMVGGQNMMARMKEKVEEEEIAESAREAKLRPTPSTAVRLDKVTKVFFEPSHYTILENVGKFPVHVKREGGDLNRTVIVDYQTEDGTASAGADYFAVIGKLSFAPGETLKTVFLEVIDDEDFEEDEHFFLRLSKPRFGTGAISPPTDAADVPAPKVKKRKGSKSRKKSDSSETTDDDYKVQLVNPFLATIIILDDDHGGIFNLAEKEVDITETIGSYSVKISRWSGARGRVGVKYTTVDGTGKAGQDFEAAQGVVTFQNNETEKTVEINIIDTDSYDKAVTFYFEISDPSMTEDNSQRIVALMKKPAKELTADEKILLDGLPKLGNDKRLTLHIKESKEFKDTVDRLVQQTNATFLAGTSSWLEQFKEAITVGGEDESGEQRVPGLGTYIIHFLTLFWKVMFTVIPPTDIWGGYVSFVCSIVAIGLLTAAIGDIASHFGCSVGLKDSVTSIVFVALGTSIPDTFASKVAACQDEFADASIGNVTGSNAVNVFLGIGIAWTIAAIYHNFYKSAPAGHCPMGCKLLDPTKCNPILCSNFFVDPGNLAFSVALFCGCAFVALTVMMLRRLEIFGGGELGGPARFKIPTGILFFALWLFYIVMSSLETYEHIKGF